MSTAALQLDFKRPPVARARGLGWLLLALVLPLVVLSAQSYRDATEVWERAQDRHAHLQGRMRVSDTPRASATPDAATVLAVRHANAVIDQLSVPWDELFAAIEAADARGLGMLSLTPNARDRTLRLAGEARSMAELLAYVERMATQPALQQVHLLGYGTTARDGVSVVSFTLAATWRQH